MSATQRTENYNLPIFIETDKPAWLVDFNGAMRSIDAQMKLNAEAIATKSPILTFQDTEDIDFTKTGDIITANLQSGITDKVGRALVKPLSAPSAEQLVAIDTNGNQAAVEIGSGLVNDNGTLKAIDLNLNDTARYTNFTGYISGTSYRAGTIYKALNADGSIGKVYGNFSINSTLSSEQVVHLDTGIVVQAPPEAYIINSAGFSMGSRVGAYSVVNLTVNTQGHVIMDIGVFTNLTTYVYIFPCLYFFKDFGDEQ